MVCYLYSSAQIIMADRVAGVKHDSGQPLSGQLEVPLFSYIKHPSDDKVVKV